MNVITAGSRYLDIDAYAGIIAYAELLQKQGVAAQAVSTAPLNESISKTIRSWPVKLRKVYTPSGDDVFTLIDVSAPEHFDTFVDHARIDTVIDHHPGFEKYWQKRIGDKAYIEPVGSACTQVYECWEKAGLVDTMSEVSARLLMCGILDNTLNFGAIITTQRDHDAYNNLTAYANLPTDWPAHYFSEIQATIDEDPVAAIQNDTKTMTFTSIKTPLHVGQMAVWDARNMLRKHEENLIETFDVAYERWFINVISISERKSYLLCRHPDVKEWLSSLLRIDFHFQGDTALSDRLWLRKEIVKQDIMISGRRGTL